MAGVEDTKRALLSAGRTEFAAFGLAGARTDRIARQSGVNKQRIYAYFGNKEGLFQAVLSDSLDLLLGMVPFPQGDLTLGEFLAQYLKSVSDYHKEHPELLRLLQWEALESPGIDLEDDSRSTYYQDKVSAFAERFTLSTEEAGSILFGVLGLAAWPHVVPQLATLIMGDKSGSIATEWALSVVCNF